MRTHKQAEKEESAVTERRTGLAYERTEVVSGWTEDSSLRARRYSLARPYLRFTILPRCNYSCLLFLLANGLRSFTAMPLPVTIVSCYDFTVRWIVQTESTPSPFVPGRLTPNVCLCVALAGSFGPHQAAAVAYSPLLIACLTASRLPRLCCAQSGQRNPTLGGSPVPSRSSPPPSALGRRKRPGLPRT
jgi:hypothetical protein